MKKLFLLSCIALFMQQANAQYYQRTYGGVATPETNARMVPCRAAGFGYMLAGSHVPPGAAAVPEVYVVRTNNAGLLPGAPFFNTHFTLIDPATLMPWPAITWSITERNAGGGIFDYLVSGIVIVNAATADYDVFVMKLTAAGAVVWINRYDFPNYSFKDPVVKMANNNIDILVTGRCADQAPGSTKQQDVFIFSINQLAGAINWGMTYDLTNGPGGASFDDIGTDIIDDPYTPGELMVVGQSSGDALLLRVNAAGGAPLPAARVPFTRFNITPNGQMFTSIRLSANPLVPALNGFIVSGNVAQGAAPQNDAWTVLMDELGVIAWSTTHDNSVAAGLGNNCNEIMERFNAVGAAEYFTVGTLNNATQDMHVLKLNNAGNLVAGGEFIYGTAVDQEQGNSIWPANLVGGVAQGFVASGTTSIFGGDQLLVKAYYNGVTQCNVAINGFVSVAAAPAVTTPACTTFINPRLQNINTAQAGLAMTTICAAPAVGGGNNAKQAPVAKSPKEDEGFNFTVLGNGEQGVSTGTDLHIAVQNAATGALTARIVDLLGREYTCKLNDEGSGRFSISSNIPSTGTYYLIVSDGKESKSKALFIK